MSEKLKDETKIVYIGGDFNIDLLHYARDGLVSQFVELSSHRIYPTMNRPVYNPPTIYESIIQNKHIN